MCVITVFVRKRTGKLNVLLYKVNASIMGPRWLWPGPRGSRYPEFCEILRDFAWIYLFLLQHRHSNLRVIWVILALSCPFGSAGVPGSIAEIDVECDLVKGEVRMTVHPATEGITVILGNGLAGCHVWADVPPPACVNLTFSFRTAWMCSVICPDVRSSWV